jgi:polyribonucleotide nucleotidyltransferase
LKSYTCVSHKTFMKKKVYTMDFGGKPLHAIFSDLTQQAHGSVLVQYGETVVLVTAVMGEKEQDIPYFPLSVEFEERFYAVGAILGSRFQRREGRPSDEAILAARIVDRTIRPLFDHQLRREVQIVVTVLAVGTDDPDLLAIIGTSLALGVSPIPWHGPVGAVRIARQKETGTIILNPSYSDRATDSLDLEVLTCGQNGTLNMIEVAAHEATEDDLVAVFEASMSLHHELEVFQQTIINDIGKTKLTVPPYQPNETLIEEFNTHFAGLLSSTVFSQTPGKRHIEALKKTWLEHAAATISASKDEAAAVFDDMLSTVLHLGAIEFGHRADGRPLDAVRPLYASVGDISPVLHGTGTFYRGDTHMLSILTLGGPGAAQAIDTIEDQGTEKRFMHHYNFPPFSVGETGRVGGANRRMVGHGALAEKALMPVLPSKTTFPYTIRLVSETMSSNGSSSMGAVCASTLALMDGGVPITKPVAGIASGVMISGDRYALLTDIQGPEDEHGDMDFKVAGTRDGITAIQMDVKVGGVSIDIITGALAAAKKAHLTILDTITACLAEPRAAISSRAPHIICLQILPEQIGLVIGSGGKTINKIRDDAGVMDITIADDGQVFITGSHASTTTAAAAIKALTKVYQVGDTCTGVVTRITNFGVFVRLDEHHEGLVHISEIVPWRLDTLTDIITEGETVPVIVIKVENGKIGLSIKQADSEFASRKGIKPPAVT